MIRKEPLRKDVEEFLLLNDRKEVEVLAIKTWFRLDKIEVPIDPYKAADAMTLPKTVTGLIESWERCQAVSQNPMKYWSDTKQSFRPVPVTNKEKESIRERNRRYTGTEDTIELIGFLRKHIQAINYANHYHSAGYTIGKIRMEMVWLSGFVHPIPSISDAGQETFRFELKKETLLLPVEEYEAFDEVDKSYLVLT
ncbi:MAG: hypothetical protein AAF502_25685 [Bacteroidota bacterium]